MKKQNFIKGSIILMVSAAAAKVLGAVFKIPLTNMLGGVGMSYFSCAYSIFMPVYALTVTGLSAAVARMTARSAALGMYANARRIRRTALLLFSAAGLAGSLLILLLAVPFSVYTVGSRDGAAAVAMIAPAVVFGCITAVERGYYEGMSNMYPTAVSQLAEGGVKAAAGLFLCGYVTAHPNTVMGLFPFMTDVRGAAAAAGIAGVTLSTVGAAAFFAVLRLFDRAPTGGESLMQSRRAIAKELLTTALPVGAGAVVTNLTALIDMWTVIGCISVFGYPGKAPAGVSATELPNFIYGSFAGIALTVFNLVPSVTNMLGKGALTCITAARESGDRSAMERGTMQALLTSAAIAIPSAVGLGVMAPEVLGILYPAQSDEVAVCTAPLRWLMAGMVCLCVSYPLFSMLQAVGKASAPLKIMLFGTAVKLLGNLLLIPLMGVSGAALSTSLCYGGILLLALRTYLKVSGLRLSFVPLGKAVYSGAMCGGAACLVRSAAYRAGASPFTALIFSALAGGIVYTFLIRGLIGRLR
nr:polysaccharide biosynthesis C-terminal domain-containing protein [Ruminococcus flavefaciens]